MSGQKIHWPVTSFQLGTLIIIEAGLANRPLCSGTCLSLSLSRVTETVSVASRIYIFSY